jgi:hypothetical protein
MTRSFIFNNLAEWVVKFGPALSQVAVTVAFGRYADRAIAQTLIRLARRESPCRRGLNLSLKRDIYRRPFSRWLGAIKSANVDQPFGRRIDPR